VEGVVTKCKIGSIFIQKVEGGWLNKERLTLEECKCVTQMVIKDTCDRTITHMVIKKDKMKELDV
jgi:hypothetical protein